MPFALDLQQAVLEGDLQVPGPDAGQLHGHKVSVLALGNVERRSPRLRARTGRLLAELAEPLAWHPAHSAHLILRAAQVIEQIPACHDGHVVLPRTSRRAGGPATREKMQFE